MVIKLKRFVSKTSSYALLAVLASLLLARKADAYLDPGTGSYIFQILLAGLVGALFMLKMYWRKIVWFFRKGSSESEATVQEPGQDMSNQALTGESVQSERSDE